MGLYDLSLEALIDLDKDFVGDEPFPGLLVKVTDSLSGDLIDQFVTDADGKVEEPAIDCPTAFTRVTVLAPAGYIGLEPTTVEFQTPTDQSGVMEMESLWWLGTPSGCPPGSPLQCLPAPNMGSALICCEQTACGCANSPDCDCGASVPPQIYKLQQGCDCVKVLDCPPGSMPPAGFVGGKTGGAGKGPGGGSCGGGQAPVKQASCMVRRVQMQTMPQLPGTHNSPQIDSASGNLVLSLGGPRGGAFDPIPVLIYNANRAATASEFGQGWTSTQKYVLSVYEPTQESVDITTGQGQALFFNAKDGNGRYRPPYSTRDALQRTSGGVWIQTQPSGFQVLYPSTTTITAAGAFASPAGNRWTLSYSGDLLQSVRDPLDRRTTYIYTGSAPYYLRRIQDPTGRLTTYTIDSGQLVRMIAPDGAITSLAYDNDNLLIRYIEPRGGCYTYGYTDGAVSSAILPGGQETAFSFTPSWNSFTDPLNNTTYTYPSPLGNIAAVVNPLDQRTSYLWDKNRLLAHIDANGNRSTFTYAELTSRQTNLASIRDAMGGIYTFVYDDSGRVKALIDQLGSRSSLLWDGAGNRVAVVDALGNRTSQVYNARGQVLAEINPLGNRASIVYDSLGQVAARVNGLGYRTSYSYQNGQMRSMQSPLGFRTTYLRDAANRVVAEIDPLGRRTSFAYDNAGHLTARINPLGFRASTLYDINGGVQATITPMGFRTTYSYNGDGSQAAVTNPLSNVTSSIYDPARRLIARVDPLESRTSYAYDPAGNRVRTENALGQITTQVFNKNDRVVAIVTPLVNRNSFGYDLAGRNIYHIDPLALQR